MSLSDLSQLLHMASLYELNQRLRTEIDRVTEAQAPVDTLLCVRRVMELVGEIASALVAIGEEAAMGCGGKKSKPKKAKPKKKGK